MSDVMAFRDTEYLIPFQVKVGITCNVCGSGEVYSPMQTMNMPMMSECLRCGTHQPTSEFDCHE